METLVAVAALKTTAIVLHLLLHWAAVLA